MAEGLRLASQVLVNFTSTRKFLTQIQFTVILAVTRKYPWVCVSTREYTSEYPGKKSILRELRPVPPHLLYLLDGHPWS
jgi:hypothetical protein